MWAPYVFKVPAYQYEQEIRFVFGTDPNLVHPAAMFATPLKGALVNLDGKTLIQGISTSPEIPADEASLVQGWFKMTKTGGWPSPEYLQEQYKQNPFTTADDPPGLFPDLD
jgi:hypothetical protein